MARCAPQVSPAPPVTRYAEQDGGALVWAETYGPSEAGDAVHAARVARGVSLRAASIAIGWRGTELDDLERGRVTLDDPSALGEILAAIAGIPQAAREGG